MTDQIYINTGQNITPFSPATSDAQEYGYAEEKNYLDTFPCPEFENLLNKGKKFPSFFFFTFYVLKKTPKSRGNKS